MDVILVVGLGLVRSPDQTGLPIPITAITLINPAGGLVSPPPHSHSGWVGQGAMVGHMVLKTRAVLVGLTDVMLYYFLIF